MFEHLHWGLPKADSCSGIVEKNSEIYVKHYSILRVFDIERERVKKVIGEHISMKKINSSINKSNEVNILLN